MHQILLLSRLVFYIFLLWHAFDEFPLDQLKSLVSSFQFWQLKVFVRDGRCEVLLCKRPLYQPSIFFQHFGLRHVTVVVRPFVLGVNLVLLLRNDRCFNWQRFVWQHFVTDRRESQFVVLLSSRSLWDLSRLLYQLPFALGFGCLFLFLLSPYISVSLFDWSRRWRRRIDQPENCIVHPFLRKFKSCCYVIEIILICDFPTLFISQWVSNSSLVQIV